MKIMLELLIKCKIQMVFMALSNKKAQDDVIALIKEIDVIIAQAKDKT